MASAKERAQRLVLRIRGEAMKRRGRRLAVEHCSAIGKQLALTNVPKLLHQLPRLVTLQGDQATLSDEATQLSLQESRLLKLCHEPYLVYVVRKLLMLSAKEAMPVPCIEALGSSFGFDVHTHTSTKLRDTVLCKYPHYFHLNRGACWKHGCVRLVQWDPELAVPERDKTLKLLEQTGGYDFGVPVDNAVDDDFSLGAAAAAVNDSVSPGFHTILQCHRYPLPSPFDQTVRRKAAVDVQLEWRRRIAVCHELLSLTLWKRVRIPALAQLREELMLDECGWLFNFLRTQLDFFSVHGDTVMLREAMDWNHVPHLTPYLQARKSLLQLMTLEEEDLTQFVVIAAERRRSQPSVDRRLISSLQT